MLVRKAELTDIEAIVRLFVADKIGGHGDDLSPAVRFHYIEAFHDISNDPNCLLLVGLLEGAVIATAQVTLVRGMSGLGAKRARISGVEVCAEHRSKGYGNSIMMACLDFIRERGVKHVFLASNKNRPRAHQFYVRMGFKMSHEGFNVVL